MTMAATFYTAEVHRDITTSQLVQNLVEMDASTNCLLLGAQSSRAWLPYRVLNDDTSPDGLNTVIVRVQGCQCMTSTKSAYLMQLRLWHGQVIHPLLRISSLVIVAVIVSGMTGQGCLHSVGTRYCRLVLQALSCTDCRCLSGLCCCFLSSCQSCSLCSFRCCCLSSFP